MPALSYPLGLEHKNRFAYGVYLYWLRYPGKSQKQIAKELNLSSGQRVSYFVSLGLMYKWHKLK